jgi:hypothetical protein
MLSARDGPATVLGAFSGLSQGIKPLQADE